MNSAKLSYRKAVFAVIFATLIWGIAGPVIKVTLNEVPPYTFLFIRCIIAGAILVPILILNISKEKFKLKIKHLPHLFMLGLLGISLNLALVFEGFKRTSSIEGVFIGSLAPILLIIAGAVFLKEEITKKERIGIVVVLIGSALLILEPIRSNGSLRLTGFIGNLLIFLGHIEWVLYVIYSKKIFNHRAHYSPLVITTFLFLTGLITYAPLSFIEYLKDPLVYNTALSFPNFWGILYMGTFSSVGGYFLYEYALERIEASETAIYSYLAPVFAAPIAILLLKETVSSTFLIAATIIIGGVIVMNLPKSLSKVLKI